MYEDEEWRAVVGYEGYYEVSSLGRVRSLDRVSTLPNGGSRFYPGRVLAQSPADKKHYRGVNLSVFGVAKMFMVHSLVAEAFLGPRPEGMQICHGDGDKENNRSGNLRYDTPTANIEDARRHGTIGRGLKPPPTHCKYGHEMTPENSFERPDSKTLRCRTCHRQDGRNSGRRYAAKLKSMRRHPCGLGRAA